MVTMKEQGYVRPKDDFFETPKVATCTMLNNINIPEDVTLWEPSCGWGKISKILEKVHPNRVLSTELNENRYGIGGVDFLTDGRKYIPEGRFWVITNPPFKCFSIDTECYTKKGWKKYNEIKEDDEVMSVNPDTLELEWSGINKIIIKENDDIMYHFKRSHLDIMCTNNHRMFAFRNGKLLRKDDDLILSQDIRSQHYIPRLGYSWKGKNLKLFTLPAINGKVYAHDVYKKEIKIPLKDWLKFFSFWLADGYCRHTKNSQGNYRKTVGIKQRTDNADMIRDILDRLPFKYHEYIDNTAHKNEVMNFEIHNEQLWSYLKQFGRSREKFIPEFIKELDTEFLKLFIDYYFYGDGSLYMKNGRIYRTSSRRLAEDLQEVLLKTGYLAHITIDKGPTDCLIYQIIYNPDSHYNKICYPTNKGGRLSVPYQGLVWCLNLKRNGVFLLRRNGKEFFCGNCANDFVRKSFEYGAERVIFLLRFNYMESGKVREDILGNGHLLRVLLMKERLQMYPYGWTGKKGSATQNHAWFIWDRNYNNPVPSEIVVRRVSLKEGKYYAYMKGIDLRDD